MKTSFPKELVIVTGAGTGIGAAVAERLAGQGAVLCIGRALSKLEALAEKVGPSLLPYSLDVADRASLDRLVLNLKSSGTSVTALINNAGIARNGASDLELAQLWANWDEVLATNLTGAFQISMAVAPFLKRPGGRIVNIGSIAAYTGGRSQGSAIYAASKAGLNGLTVGLAREFSGDGITVNAIAPGLVAGTEFTAAWDPDRIEAFVSEVPAGRPGRADEIAATVAFLCCPDAGYITGQVIHQNGGAYFAP
ncbi:SDR family oxidoreductase [Nisaea sp.]|uniref:SDR family NAD(P)-dependent oxidoreductase n=1 Tax=Nisaea sp. TaxID=2024842 RepID=UPI0032ECDCB2